jgi:hypothetical protein
MHHRQRLPFRFKPGNGLLGVHPQLDHFERHGSAHRFGLLCEIDYAATTFTDTFQGFIAPNLLADGFIRCSS